MTDSKTLYINTHIHRYTDTNTNSDTQSNQSIYMNYFWISEALKSPGNFTFPIQQSALYSVVQTVKYNPNMVSEPDNFIQIVHLGKI